MINAARTPARRPDATAEHGAGFIRFTGGRKDRFHQDVVATVSRVFRAKRLGTKATALVWVKGGLLLIVMGGCYWISLFSGADPLWRLAAFFVFGISLLGFALNICHEAAHKALSGRSTLDSALHYLVFSFLGVDAFMWKRRHLGSHHIFPNVNGCDADIDDNPFLRLSPNQPWQGHFRYQHLYAWLIYGLVAVHGAFIQDINYLKKTRLANISAWRLNGGQLIKFFVGKGLHIGALYVLPILFLPFSTWVNLLVVLAMLMTLSLLFILPLIATHFSDLSVFPVPDGRNRLPVSWARHQMETSIDWHATSYLANHLIGGLNAHCAHHLFPRVSHAHYPWISRIIGRKARRHGVPHRNIRLLEAVRSHYRFLKMMADPTTRRSTYAA